jgi:hypothetical protein
MIRRPLPCVRRENEGIILREYDVGERRLIKQQRWLGCQNEQDLSDFIHSEWVKMSSLIAECWNGWFFQRTIRWRVYFVQTFPVRWDVIGYRAKRFDRSSEQRLSPEETIYGMFHRTPTRTGIVKCSREPWDLETHHLKLITTRYSFKLPGVVTTGLNTSAEPRHSLEKNASRSWLFEGIQDPIDYRWQLPPVSNDSPLSSPFPWPNR